MSIESIRDEVAQLVKSRDLKIVFAESCTAGLVSATMAQVSGISNHLCGSAATYRPATKHSWLQVSNTTMDQFTCESKETVEAMLEGVLKKTPEADWGAAIVGHLEGDQLFIWVSVGKRQHDEISITSTKRFDLQTDSRIARQVEAAEIVLKELAAGIVNA